MFALFEEIKKLKSKLAELEVEQERQDQELYQTIKDFEEISRLEAELLGIDHNELKLKVLDNLTFLRDTDEDTKKLEAELSEADKMALQKANKAEPMIHDDEETRRLEQELEGLGAPKVQNHKHYFTICLVSPDGSYSEWSEEAGGGWHSVGLGRQYTDHDAALILCEKVQKKFPHYLVKLVEKS
ncbi:MAG: hypothetical protein VSS52_009425 [Thiotrichaceae bacterium]|nr:hypothetical protein [Thiotrichaceae bacterium]